MTIDGLSVRTQQGSAHNRDARIGRVVRRLEFDHELANRVRAKGIRIEENASATALVMGERGVTITTPQGEVRARAVVGADGVGSFVRRAAGIGSDDNLLAQVIEVDTEPVPSDLPRDLLHFDTEDRSFPGYTWDFPTLVGGEEKVCRGIYHLRLDGRPVDIQSILEGRLAGQGLDLGRYKLKRYAERGFRPQRPQSAPRVLLVGEAAGIDGLSGEGIAQSVEYAALAGPYLAEKLAGGDSSFRDWSTRVARTTLGFDSAAPPPSALVLRRSAPELVRAQPAPHPGVHRLQHGAIRRAAREEGATALATARRGVGVLRPGA